MKVSAAETRLDGAWSHELTQTSPKSSSFIRLLHPFSAAFPAGIWRIWWRQAERHVWARSDALCVCRFNAWHRFCSAEQHGGNVIWTVKRGRSAAPVKSASLCLFLCASAFLQHICSKCGIWINSRPAPMWLCKICKEQQEVKRANDGVTSWLRLQSRSFDSYFSGLNPFFKQRSDF